MIYIACPSNFATGGTELLHQLAYTINLLGHKACIYYSGVKTIDPVHERFKFYNIPFITNINDMNDAKVLVVPEIMVEILHYQFPKNCQKIIWWLSVDNYIVAHPRRNFLEKIIRLLFKKQKWNYFDYTSSVVKNYVQSEYARQFIINKGAVFSGFLSDYLSDIFLCNVFSANEANVLKENIVLYNPKKGYKITKKLIKSASHINFIPLENMSPKEMIPLLQKAKVYIDFGNHPGKDRIPREAAIMGCCVLVGKIGSAANDIDIPIPLSNKFDINPLLENEVIQKIEQCFINYSIESNLLDNYRSLIQYEKKIFIKQVKLFLKDNLQSYN